MRHQYDEFDRDRKTFQDISKRMENEKLKISEERERIESEVRRIKELNGQLQGQIQMTTCGNENARAGTIVRTSQN